MRGEEEIVERWGGCDGRFGIKVGKSETVLSYLLDKSASVLFVIWLPEGETVAWVSTQVAHQDARTVWAAGDETKPLSDAVVYLIKAGRQTASMPDLKCDQGLSWNRAIREVMSLPCSIREARSYANVDKTERTRADRRR